MQVVRLLGRYSLIKRGTVTAIARELRVHPSTVSRDIHALLREHGRCPQCGQLPALGGGLDPEFTDLALADQAKRDGPCAARGRGTTPPNEERNLRRATDRRQKDTDVIQP